MRKLTKNFITFLSLALATQALAGDPDDPSPRETPIPIGNNFPTQPRTGRFVEHLEQRTFRDLVRRGQPFDAFDLAREKGDDFFDNLFLADSVFGAGANVGQGQRFTRVPRADLKGPKEWANHFPERATGPNAAACIECHAQGRHDGGGFAGLNAIRDPLHSGNPAFFINRNTPHLFGQGALQLLAEEITDELHAILAEAKEEACGKAMAEASGPGGRPPRRRNGVVRNLVAKGIDFGKIKVQRQHGGTPECVVDFSGIEGIDKDLVLKPFQWKGSVAFIRDFNRGAAHNENGQQAVEIVGDNVDGDGDGVVNEVSIGDMTALTVYIADQPRPTTKIELASLGKIPPVPENEIKSIRRGGQEFEKVGCAGCHTPAMKLASSVFSEPSQSPFYRDKIFPAGQDPVARGLDPKHAIKVDLTKEVVSGFTFKKDADGKTVVELYSDLKRHDMGPEDAESIDEAGTGPSVFLTRPLWGVGSTPPYMHDGRATTIEQAVEAHGGEAADTRMKFKNLSPSRQADLVNFLKNLRVWKLVDIDS